jgi:hypothetical protein
VMQIQGPLSLQGDIGHPQRGVGWQPECSGNLGKRRPSRANPGPRIFTVLGPA